MDQDGLAFDDRTLIRLVSAGQSEYFVVLMARHMPAVRRRVQSIRQTPSEVDDTIQDVVLKIWTRLSTFRGRILRSHLDASGCYKRSISVTSPGASEAVVRGTRLS